MSPNNLGIVLTFRDASQFTLSSIFSPLVTAWLDDTAVKMRQWADNALRLDDVGILILPTRP